MDQLHLIQRLKRQLARQQIRHDGDAVARNVLEQESVICGVKFVYAVKSRTCRLRIGEEAEDILGCEVAVAEWDDWHAAAVGGSRVDADLVFAQGCVGSVFALVGFAPTFARRFVLSCQ